MATAQTTANANSNVKPPASSLDVMAPADEEKKQQADRLLKEKDYNKAIDIYENLYESYQNNLSLLKTMGLAYQNIHNQQKALSLFNQSLYISYDANIAKQIMNYWLEQDDEKKMEGFAKTCLYISNAGKDDKAYYRLILAKVMKKQGKMKRALKFYQSALPSLKKHQGLPQDKQDKNFLALAKSLEDLASMKLSEENPNIIAQEKHTKKESPLANKKEMPKNKDIHGIAGPPDVEPIPIDMAEPTKTVKYVNSSKGNFDDAATNLETSLATNLTTNVEKNLAYKALHHDHQDNPIKQAYQKLKLQDYEAGWSLFEQRLQGNWLKSENGLFEVLAQKKHAIWDGATSIENKTLAVIIEGEIEDILLMLRYIKPLDEAGIRVHFVLGRHYDYFGLLLQDYPGLAKVVKMLADLDDFDYIIPLLSLPLAVGKMLNDFTPPQFNAPAVNKPYDERWNDELVNIFGDLINPIIAISPLHVTHPNGGKIHDTDIILQPLINKILPVLKDRVRLVMLMNDLNLDQAIRDKVKPSLSPDFKGQIHIISDSIFENLAERAAFFRHITLTITASEIDALLCGNLQQPCWVLSTANYPEKALARWYWGNNDATTPLFPSHRLFPEQANKNGVLPTMPSKQALMDITNGLKQVIKPA